jgi:hypothetical protein
MTPGGGKVVIRTHRPPVATGDIPGTYFFKGLFDFRSIVRPENPNDLSGNRTR